MLQRLTIRNFAIIDHLSVQFANGLNIITGETGAGKSILMNALSLILGERADSSMLNDQTQKCVIEAFFLPGNRNDIRHFLQTEELDWEEILTIRREISSQGKSRAFINDTPVNLSQLKNLGRMLVDLHQQFDTLELGEDQFQLHVIDAMAGNSEASRTYRKNFLEYQKALHNLQQLKEAQQLADTTLDYNRFLYDELAELQLKPGELETLEEEIRRMNHAETVKTTLNRIFSDIHESEQPLTQQIKQLIQRLAAIEKYHSGIQQLTERLHSLQIELADIGDECDQLNQQLQIDEEAIQQAVERMEKGYRLLKKHHVSDTHGLLLLFEDLENKLQQVVALGDAIQQAESVCQQQETLCRQLAVELSAKRQQVIEPFSNQVNQLLNQVGMPNARIQVLCSPSALKPDGADAITFLFDANKTGRFEPIQKVASGGELSRLMLCIKSLIAQKLELPTLIFDEIDTGISGEAARQVGLIMQSLGKSLQVMAITHQPQIAARANSHFFVHKTEQGDRMVTSIRELSKEERIQVIARMLSGENPTTAAMENARELILN